MHANVDIPAPLMAALLLGSIAGWALLLLIAFIGWWRMKPKWTRAALWLGFAGTVVYGALLYGYAWRSKEKTLARGVEKYFCELDCHLAYAVVNVEQPKAWAAEGSASVTRTWKVTLRTRFDETTTAAWRPKEVALTPNPRVVEIIGKDGHAFSPSAMEGTPLMQPLRPGESYTTVLTFQLPTDIKDPRLLLRETMWPSYVGIGSENSPGHRKTYFGLQ